MIAIGSVMALELTVSGVTYLNNAVPTFILCN